MARRSSRKIDSNSYTIIKLLTPQIIISGIFLIGIISGIAQSLGVIPSLGLTKPTLDYYKEIFSDPNIITSISYSFKIAFISSFIATLFGVLLSGIIVMNHKENSLYTKIIQFPIIVPHLIVALLVINIFSQNGILSRLMYSLGLINDQQGFPRLIYDSNGIGVILAYLWKEIPFIIYFVITMMSKINNNLGEAATNLGAKKWTVFYKVTLPLCKNVIFSGFLIIFVFSLGAYELPSILGATTPRALPVLTYVEYMHPDLKNRPYAMALNGITIIISFLATLIYYSILNNRLRDFNKGNR